jgi:uncharacterized membrane protein
MKRPGLAGRRALVGTATAAVTIVLALVLGAPVSVSCLLGWDVAAIHYLGSVWWRLPWEDAARTKRWALSEDSSRAAAEAMLLGAGIASLVAVAFTLVQAGNHGSPARGLLTGLAIASVVLSWTSVQTVYMLRYGRLYYGDPEGGIDFGDDAPSYEDLAYLSFTIGMCFQVSDTTLTAKPVRRLALHHALQSYIFGTVIVAVTINIVAGLIGT